ncbi:Por secretion system C-terminal sorting domain-containing protein [Hymenobacter gelipurpurascens]|uniref:Por secretion system C-terminal sorting domain-containing protein n=1 Tax=Hymenobacter gelipurpurascens TaxID=89968 RepID=A0A212TJI6_9BACT|nr:T9SS type A sorting domain-containing protein [Hymenobacter gelipurpurascens]SNC66050.1 Por secretion system C-terminal sorting domain-containing protein [Hymenobacter gelipurpurascens]
MESLLPYFSPKAFLLTSLLLLGYSLPAAQAQTPFFGSAISVGTTKGQGESYVGGTAIDAQGNTYVAGGFAGHLHFGSKELISRAGGKDVFVAKFDAAGNTLWAVSAGSDSYDDATGLALDGKGNVYITGQYYGQALFGAFWLPDAQGARPGNVFAAKLTSSGSWEWATHGGGDGNDHGAALYVDAAGNSTIVGGFSSSTATFGALQVTNDPTNPDDQDVFVARLTPSGVWVSAMAVGGPRNDQATNVALDAAGNTYVCGTYSSDGIRFGTRALANSGSAFGDIFIAKLAPTRSWEWAAHAGGTNNETAMGLAIDPDGMVYVSGSYTSPTATFGPVSLANGGAASTMDVYVASLDASGAWRWATRAGGPSSDYSSGLVLTGSGQILITGGFISASVGLGAFTLPNSNATAIGKMDSYVAKLTTQGEWQWALGTLGQEDEEARTLTLAPDGSVSVVGTYWGSPSFGATTLVGNPMFPNVFLAKVYDQGLLASLTTVAPSSGAPGQMVTLTGSGFVGVTDVLFNGTPAASFTVQSATSLEATVPAGATAGPVSVRTSAGLAASAAVVFQPTAVTATTHAATSKLQLYPNPATTFVHLPGLAAGSRVQLVDLVGRPVRTAILASNGRVSVQGLAPGLYTLRATNQQGQHFAGKLLVE